MSTPLVRELAEWAIGTAPDRAPTAVRAAAQRHLLDALGCALAAAQRDEVSFIRRAAGEIGGAPEAAAIGGPRLPAQSAALVNSALVHALDFDDTHLGGLVHPGAVVVPTALAVAELAGSDGAQLLSACIIGMEVMARLGLGASHGFHRRGLHATSVCGPFAAALVAARLLGLDVDATTRAVGIAGSFAAGSLEYLSDGSTTKRIQPAWASQAGIWATRLARQGADGPVSALDGPFGLYRTHAGQEVDRHAVLGGLGETWETTRIALKRYPACHLAENAIRAAEAAQIAGVPISAISNVDVEIHPDVIPICCAPLDYKVSPRTPYDAKFSVPWCVAAMLLDGTLTIEHFSDSQISRPDVRSLAAKVSYGALDSEMPAAAAPARLTLRLDDGAEITKIGRADHVESTAAGRLVHTKIAANVNDPRIAERLCHTVTGLETPNGFEDLIACLQGDTRHGALPEE